MWCPHLEDGVRPPDGAAGDWTLASPCGDCGDASENWICLCCYAVRCGRHVAGHMVRHYHVTGHPLALSFSDLSVWCYVCDAYVDNPVRTVSFYVLKVLVKGPPRALEVISAPFFSHVSSAKASKLEIDGQYRHAFRFLFCFWRCRPSTKPRTNCTSSNLVNHCPDGNDLLLPSRVDFSLSPNTVPFFDRFFTTVSSAEPSRVGG